MKKLLILVVLSLLFCPPAWPQQDLSQGTGVFIQKPENPPARRPRQKRSAARRARAATPEPKAAQGAASEDDADAAAGASTTGDMLEDALWLGNEARDSDPPRYEEAERAYRLAAKLAPKDPRPHVGLGNIFWDQKRLDQAAAAYRNAVQLSGPYNAKITTEVRTREREAEAEERAARRRGRRSSPTNRAAHRLSEEARFLYASAAMIGQEQAYLGATLMQRGSYAEAEAALKKATVQNPENAEWWALLGAVQIEQRKYAAARRSLRSALFLEPYEERYAELLQRAGGRPNR